MNKVYACIDGHANTPAVIDAGVWSAQRLSCPLVLAHVIEPQLSVSAGLDASGAIGLGAPDVLLQQLSELDAQRHQLAQEAGRRMVTVALARARDAGLTEVDSLLRHDELNDAAQTWQDDARLFVLGQHHQPATRGRRHLDHHIERMVRSVSRTVLVVTGETFTPPDQIVVAYDGSTTAERMIERLAASPILTGLPVTLLRVGTDTPDTRAALLQARQKLEVQGRHVESLLSPGVAETEILSVLNQRPRSLLAMGAYGHSRIREFIVGSTTTTLLRLSPVPVMVLR
ncbi:MAG: universal stress protein [Aquabacterium sp.]|jgi:nucleotide-binding universal stress UspA family protein|uniref:universal stress protein n=1 Tax=Aquabacterium sp. TaxID=1872578 RepID=UPI001B5B781C|nr:universal stress protein [Aquabacterium sp.]MBP7133556.1 universal stress protein [Aquabacterium sp.]